MTYSLVQVICGICAFLGVGQAVNKEATRFDKIAGFVICAVFLAFILYIEEVLK